MLYAILIIFQGEKSTYDIKTVIKWINLGILVKTVINIYIHLDFVRFPYVFSCFQITNNQTHTCVPINNEMVKLNSAVNMQRIMTLCCSFAASNIVLV